MARETRALVNELLTHVRTIGDAVDAVEKLFLDQIDNANDALSAPNEAVEGDAAARDAFLTILPKLEQRALFLRMIRISRFWPRIRTLVGSPPFSFLKEEDDNVLRAAGIARSRQHMAKFGNDISNHSSFGSAQFLDASERDFKIMHRRDSFQVGGSRFETLPFVGLRGGDGVVLECRLRKRSLAKKIRIAQGMEDVARDAVVFPRVGTEISLEPTKRMRVVADPLTVFVCSVQPRSAEGTVARLICKVR